MTRGRVCCALLRAVAPCCTMLHICRGLLHGLLYQPFPVLQAHARSCNNISEAASDAASLVAYSCNSAQQLLRCRPYYRSATQQQPVATQHLANVCSRDKMEGGG